MQIVEAGWQSSECNEWLPGCPTGTSRQVDGSLTDSLTDQTAYKLEKRVGLREDSTRMKFIVYA